MNRPPRRAEVDRALKAAESEVAASLKALNKQAASLLARGDYVGAEKLVNVGREIEAFRRGLTENRRQWKGLGIQAVGQGNGTPMWEFYRPILQTLVELGGEAKRAELERELEPRVAGFLRDADGQVGGGNRPRWKNLVRRARRAMVKEGFIEDGGLTWRITDSGRAAAEARD